MGIAGERNTICNAFPLMLGAYCALLMRDSEKRAFIAKLGKWLFVLSLALMVEFLVSRIHALRGAVLDELSGLSINVAFGLLLLSAIDGPAWLVGILSLKPICRIGRYSYGMYVYHIAIFTAFAWLLPQFHVLRGIVEILAAIAIAALSYELFERRINGLKRHFESRRRSSRAVAA
jgi:peptidoglycan/LPS O-acetylase OafA/YrhL